MQFERLFAVLASKIFAQLGGDAQLERVAHLAAPVEEWTDYEFLQYLHRVRARTADEFMGLASQRCPPGLTAFVVEIATRCSTLGEALAIGCRVFSTVTDGLTIELVENGNFVALEVREAPGGIDSGRVLTDWNMIIWHRLSEWLIGAEIPLERAEIGHALDSDYSAYAAMFGSGCVFNSDAGRLIFSREVLDQRIVRTPSSAEQLQEEARASFPSPTELARTWNRQVRNILRGDIADGRPFSSIEEVSDHFRVSSQTLRRKLRSEGSSYREIIGEVRREIAMDVLANQNATVSQASVAAGFAEANALTRALKNRQGMSSSELRNIVQVWRGGDGASSRQEEAVIVRRR